MQRAMTPPSIAAHPTTRSSVFAVIEKLPLHTHPLVGRICPRCGGQIVCFHAGDFDVTCLQCGSAAYPTLDDGSVLHLTLRQELRAVMEGRI